MLATLLIAVAVRQPSARKHVLDQLDVLQKDNELAKRLGWIGAVLVEPFSGQKLHEDLAAAEDRIERLFAGESTAAAMLISDVDDDKPDEVLDALVKGFAPRLFGTIAVTERGDRVAEIDRVVKRGGPLAELRNAIELVAARLHYLSAPTRTADRQQPTVRRIQDEFELKKYFQLRHRIYSIMGYLDPLNEQVPSQMEIDASDGSSVHLGAFTRGRGFDTLVGTVRLVLAESEGGDFEEWTNTLLKSDRQLRALVKGQIPLLTLRLPVFHSQQLDDHLQASIQRQLRCAELSRVIVDVEHRGRGISTLLVEAALAEARRRNVHRLYLECLKTHEKLYQKHGFETIPNKSGRVLGINRTMIPMQRDVVAAPAPLAAAPAAAVPAVSAAST